MTLDETARQNLDNFRQKSYPGRGIVVGASSDGKRLFQIYWTMGRSQNSRNRIFVREGDEVKNRLYREDPDADTSLIIYYPLRSANAHHVVGNGDQTDTVCEYLSRGDTFLQAIDSRTFEPDAPHFTPRITGIAYGDSSGRYDLSILKSTDGGRTRQRSYHVYNQPMAGLGHCITTYVDDGFPLPPFTGEPFLMKVHDSLEDNVSHFWNILNRENRISICGKEIDLATNGTTIKIVNKDSDGMGKDGIC